MGVPIIYSEKEFDAAKDKTFFDYLTFKLLLTKSDENSGVELRKTFNANSAGLYAPEEVHGFFEQIGKNTGYIIHPEEILAENFVHMLMQTKDLKSPEIVDKMRQTILKYNSAQQEEGHDPTLSI